MSKKGVFVVAYVVVAFVAFVLFFYYSFSRYSEERAINEAEFLARYPSLRGFAPDYYPFPSSVYGRNVFWFGIVLIFGGLISWLVLTIGSGMLSARRRPEAQRMSIQMKRVEYCDSE